MKKILLFVVLFSSFFVKAFDENVELQIKAGQQKINLTDDEIKILKNGELSGARYGIGGVVGTYPLGLGIGHAIQGRWGTEGWKFTAGELTSIGIVAIGASKCVSTAFLSTTNCDNGLLTVGLVGLFGFRIWEIIEVWHGGYRQMEDYPVLKQKILGTSLPTTPKSSFFILPNFNSQGSGIVLGATF